jgi:DNA repair protein RadC
MALGLPQARPAAPPVEEEPHYHGHRERLRQRFLDSSGEGMPDYEILELLLFRAIPRRDVKPLAKAVLKHFGSFAEAVHASRERLAEVPGLGQAAIAEIKIVQEAARRFLQRDLERKPLLSSWGQVCDYLRATMAFDTNEQFRILFLDKRNRLIADEMQQRGTVDHTSVYVREVVKRALELSATAIVLSHNHPSGDPTPSQADIKMTREIIDAASKVGVLVHDHVIVGKDGHLSLRQAELI